MIAPIKSLPPERDESPRTVFRTFMRAIAICALAAMLLVAGTGLTFARSSWPTITMPKGVTPFDIASGPITVNGMPMRVHGFVSGAKTEQVAAWFRQILGQPLVENRVDGKTILGQAKGDYYVTVQLDRARTGTRGLISMAHLGAAAESQTAANTVAEHWLARMPAGSNLVSQVASEDAGKVARHFIFLNSHSAELNHRRLKELMLEDGFELEREAVAAPHEGSTLPDGASGGRTLFFRGAGREATAVIFQDRAGRSAVVLNTVVSMERFK